MDNTNALLTIKDLNLIFRNEDRINHVLRGVDLDIKQGEIVGLVGESGSGKSVTGLALCGLLPKKSAQLGGSILFQQGEKETELIGLAEKSYNNIRGRQISMIFQEPMSSLNPVLTCGFQVDEMTRLHLQYNKAQAKSKTLELFHQVGIPNPERIYQSYPHQISGGQIQRVMIAMAISCNPKLLIADEPTTALDVTIQKRILDLLVDIKDKFGISVLFISHDLGVIRGITSRVNVMYRGKIVESGNTDSVLSSPNHLYTKGLIACKPPLTYRLDRLPVISDYVEIDWKENEYQFVPVEKTKTNTITEKPINSDKEDDILLQVENLSVKYAVNKSFWGRTTLWLTAVDNVSFDLRKGETLGIVGESGCGKSTLGRTLVELETPASGEALFEGNSIFKRTKSEAKDAARQIQIIFQDPYSSLNPKMKIGDAIIEPMMVHGLYRDKKGRKEKMLSLLDQVGLLPEHANRYPHEFSGGQRQRISIARALGLQPQILICDESVAALDVSVQSQVLNLLKDLQKTLNLSMIFITHDMSVVNYIADRICVMHKGKFVETGTTNQVIHHPVELYTKDLIEAIPKWS